MNILIYMSGGFDFHGPSNHLFSTLIEDIIKKGHKVHLIQKKTGSILNELNEDVLNNHSFINYYVNQKAISKKKLISRYLSSVAYSFKSRKTIKKVLSESKIDLVLFQSNPTPLFQIKSVRKYFKGPIVYNIQDIFPGSTIATGKMKSKILQAIFTKLSLTAYLLVNHITVISEDTKRLLVNQGVESNKISIILNWYDDESVQEKPWEQNIFVKKYNLSKDKFYIQYAGGMGYVFDYNAIIHVAKKLINIPNIVFLMIGNGSLKEKFMMEAKKNNLPNIIFFDMQPQSLVSDVYSACNVQIIPLKRNVIGNSVPSKVALLMACNRLIINSVDEESEFYSRFKKYNIGLSVSNNDYDELYKIIIEVYENPLQYNKFIRKAYDFGKTNYSRSVNTALYLQLFHSLIAQ